MASIDLGPAGAVVIAATGIYLAGDYPYHHWKPFHDVADDVGHGVVKAEEFLSGQDYSADLAIAHAAGHVGNVVADAAEDTIQVVDGERHITWHSVVSAAERWF